MAAFRAMMPGWLVHGDLPPAGNRVVFSAAECAPPEFAGYAAHWVQSGTAALALGMLVARSRRPELKNPTVILPAYGCPDLIAAAVYAGVQPVLVDIGSDDPGYDLDCLAQAIDTTTVAVVAVNFLGIRERLDQIRQRLSGHPQVMLIEDNAQWFPEPWQSPGLIGDLVCLSFGRGKPVSLLGGGVLLVRQEVEVSLPPLQSASEEGVSLAIKTRLFNLLLQRRLYPLVNRNPLFELGRTVYKPLTEVRALDELRRGSVLAAAQHYLSLSRASESAWQEVFPALALTESALVEPFRRGRLLRYPILCRDQLQRDRLWRKLDAAGLGVSAMYRAALPEVSGVAGTGFRVGAFSNARMFAGRLLTLPVHEGVGPGDFERARRVAAD